MPESRTLNAGGVAGALKGFDRQHAGGPPIVRLWLWVLLVSRLCLFSLPCWNVGSSLGEGTVSSVWFS